MAKSRLLTEFICGKVKNWKGNPKLQCNRNETHRHQRVNQLLLYQTWLSVMQLYDYHPCHFFLLCLPQQRLHVIEGIEQLDNIVHNSTVRQYRHYQNFFMSLKPTY